jgi:photosystem II stability/assembly factor-like uncharacterized protein
LCVVFLLLLSVASFAQGWQFAYQQELLVDFQAVDFPSSTVGYAVGSGGVIYKSTDGGQTWALQTSPVTLTLFDVHFTSETNGWAVGDNGTMVFTTDGTTWVESDSSGVMTTRDLNAVRFIGSNGWIGGDAGTMFRSTDGGVSWSPPTVNPYTDDCNDLDFVDANIGYAAMDGDGIMYTTDGGDNWVVAAVNLGPYPYTRQDIEAIEMIDDTLAVASGWGSLVGLQPTIILISEDAGKSWNTPDPTYPWATYGYAYSLATFDNGDVILTGGGSSSAAFVHHREYAGDGSWTNSPAIQGEDTRDACALPGTDRVVVVGDEGSMALSTDRGNTWQFVFDPGPGFAGWIDVEHAGSVWVFVVGANGALLRLPLDITSDPVLSDVEFTVVAPENFAPTRLHDVDYISGVLYVSGSNGYLCKSSDLGATWTQLQHTPSATDAIYSMYWFNTLDGVLVGERASREIIYRTFDGGQTLNVVWEDSTGASLQWNSVSFSPDTPNVGVVAGDNNAFAYTTDLGNTWTWAAEDIGSSTADLEEVWMVSATTGWAVGDAGLHLKTTDGGQNWFVQPAVTTEGLMDVQFQSPDWGYMVGNDTTFLYTTDGGTSWTAEGPLLDPVSKDINCVHYQGIGNKVWIGADEGDLLYRHNDNVTAADDPSIPYLLGQNYPNPFNPSTMIEFSLPKNDLVELKVYDVAGRLVATVLDKQMEAGVHTVHYDAKGLASGIYFYRLRTSAGVQTKKMVLLR